MDSGKEIPSEQFQFNVSHSGDYCVLAAECDSSKLGVDLMKIECTGGIERLEQLFRNMRRQFSEDEWRFIRNGDSEWAKLARFIRLWSLKESLVKAEGTGITFPLSKISFVCQSELNSGGHLCDTIVKIEGNPLPGWLFEESMIDGRHHVSVARTPPNHSSHYEFQQLTIKELLEEFPSTLDDLFSYQDEKYWTDFCTKS